MALAPFPPAVRHEAGPMTGIDTQQLEEEIKTTAKTETIATGTVEKPPLHSSRRTKWPT